MRHSPWNLLNPRLRVERRCRSVELLGTAGGCLASYRTASSMEMAIPGELQRKCKIPANLHPRFNNCLAVFGVFLNTSRGKRKLASLRGGSRQLQLCEGGQHGGDSPHTRSSRVSFSIPSSAQGEGPGEAAFRLGSTGASSKRHPVPS